MKKAAFLVIILLFSNLFPQQKIGLALSGGGARGLAHIGVLKVIDEMDIPISYISGTSIGAVIGALYSIGYPATEIENIFLQTNWKEVFIDNICREDVYIGQKRWKPYANYFFDLDQNFLPKLPLAISSGNEIINKMFDLTYPVSHLDNFDDYQIPFRCLATNILNGETKVFSTGSLPEALRASMSIPSLFKPFELGNELFIDGGVKSNLPVETAKGMGADFVIASQVNSGLRTEEELQNLIHMLDQTINLSIIRNVNESAELCDFLIKPDLGDISFLDFEKAKTIINLGEEEAWKILSQIEFSPKVEDSKSKPAILPANITFSRISVSGNKYLHPSKILEYVELKKGISYTKKDILQAIKHAYNSELFTFIYPVIREKDGKYELIIKVVEKDRKRYGVNLNYNNNNEIVAGLTLDLTNVLQKNSKLICNLQVGARHELNLDYVKNFGKHWGVYFRIFPYLKEHKLFSYNDDHEKMNSVKSLETGGTLGIGIFAREIVIAEVFGYSFKTRMYRDIADFEDTQFTATGLGFKLYHESLDDYVFPMRGSQFLIKLTGARKVFFSDEGYKKMYARIRMLLPFARNISLKYQFEYGSYFKKYDIDFDPFYIGGFDSFMGLYSRERSAPIYQINTLALRSELYDHFFGDLHFNFLNLGNTESWLPEENTYYGAGIKLGYQTFFGPLRIGAAIAQDRKAYYYLSVGYEFDAFEFSRK